MQFYKALERREFWLIGPIDSSLIVLFCNMEMVILVNQYNLYKFSNSSPHSEEWKLPCYYFCGDFELFTKNSNLKLLYQITEDEKYCLGSALRVPNGWKEFPFEFDTDIVARIIAKHLESQELDYTAH